LFLRLDSLRFINPDGSHNQETVVKYVTTILKQHGLKEENTIQRLEGLVVYPTDYFCPMDFRTGAITITENTHSIHYYDMSWWSPYQQASAKRKRKIIDALGDTVFSKIVIAAASAVAALVERVTHRYAKKARAESPDN